MFIVFMRSSLCIYKRGVIHFCSPFLTQKSNSIFSNQLIFTVDVLFWLDGVLVSSCSVSVEMGSCSLVICDSTCLKTHCSINVDGMCSWKCGAAVRALCWSVPVSASYIPTNVGLYVPALYGMAAASRRVIGYRADCFACRPFFRPFVVSFFQSPLPLPLSPQLLFSHTWTHTNIV